MRSIPNADAFTRLYEETYLIVFRYVYGLSGGPLQESEDLTAETYARAWKTRQGFHGDGQAALGWLLRIARNLAIDLSRRRKVRDVPVIFPQSRRGWRPCQGAGGVGRIAFRI